ncbi:MAG: N-acetyltransferase [Anaerolineae bacterium]|nr:N-acetyltransferase [Anaerolineae bacterium]
MARDFEVLPVETLRDRKAFVGFQYELYRHDPNWVPYLRSERMEFTDRQRCPFFEHGDVAFFRAVRRGRTIGTIAAIRNDRHNEFHGERTGFFGLFDVIEEYPVAEALFDAAREWVRTQGMDTLRGPMSYSTNEECGLLIDGFDMPPVVMMTYNPRYYPEFVERYGFRKARDLYAYRVRAAEIGEDGAGWPAKVRRAAEVAQRRYKVHVRKVNMRRLEKEIALAKQVYNDAWSRNWGFVPVTDAEFDHLARALKPFLDPDLVFIAEVDGHPVGVSVTLPDVNQAFIGVRDGRLFPVGWIRYLWGRRRINAARVIIMGVVKEYQLRGIDAIFYLRTLEEAWRKGYEWGEMSWILEDNFPMRQAAEALNGRIYKTYRVYDLPL